MNTVDVSFVRALVLGVSVFASFAIGVVMADLFWRRWAGRAWTSWYNERTAMRESYERQLYRAWDNEANAKSDLRAALCDLDVARRREAALRAALSRSLAGAKGTNENGEQAQEATNGANEAAVDANGSQDGAQ